MVKGNLLATTNQDHMHSLQERVSQLEEELRRALERAEEAEAKLKQYKTESEMKSLPSEKTHIASSPQPPPPPPLPLQLLYKPQVRVRSAEIADVPTFGDIIASSSLRKTSDSSTEQTSSPETQSQCRPKPLFQPATGRLLDVV